MGSQSHFFFRCDEPGYFLRTNNTRLDLFSEEPSGWQARV